MACKPHIAKRMNGKGLVKASLQHGVQGISSAWMSAMHGRSTHQLSSEGVTAAQLLEGQPQEFDSNQMLGRQILPLCRSTPGWQQSIVSNPLLTYDVDVHFLTIFGDF